MKKRVEIKADREIRYPALLSGALESMGFLVERVSNGEDAGNGTGDNGFDLKIEDSQGHTFQGFNLERWFKSRKPPE